MNNYLEKLPEVHPELTELLEFPNFDSMAKSLKAGDHVWSIASTMGHPETIRRLIVTNVQLEHVWAEPAPEGEKPYFRDDDVIVSPSSHKLLHTLFTRKDKAVRFCKRLRECFDEDPEWQKEVSRRLGSPRF